MKFAYYNARYRIDCALYGEGSAKAGRWLGKIMTLGFREGFHKARKNRRRTNI